MRRIPLVLVAIMVGALVAMTAACGASTPAGDNADQPPSSTAPEHPVAPSAPAAVLSYAPGAEATAASVRAPATVTVADGTLAEAGLTNAKGEAVKGKFNADRTRWTSTEPLAYGSTYTWTGTASGADGVALPLAGSFSTVKPKKVVRGTLNIPDDRTVGIAAPIRIQFTAHVSDKAAVEKALSVETSTPV